MQKHRIKKTAWKCSSVTLSRPPPELLAFHLKLDYDCVIWGQYIYALEESLHKSGFITELDSRLPRQKGPLKLPHHTTEKSNSASHLFPKPQSCKISYKLDIHCHFLKLGVKRYMLWPLTYFFWIIFLLGLSLLILVSKFWLQKGTIASWIKAETI